MSSPPRRLETCATQGRKYADFWFRLLSYQAGQLKQRDGESIGCRLTSELDCYWVGSLDFNFLVENYWCFPLNPPKSEKHFLRGGGGRAIQQPEPGKWMPGKLGGGPRALRWNRQAHAMGLSLSTGEGSIASTDRLSKQKCTGGPSQEVCIMLLENRGPFTAPICPALKADLSRGRQAPSSLLES